MFDGFKSKNSLFELSWNCSRFRVEFGVQISTPLDFSSRFSVDFGVQNPTLQIFLLDFRQIFVLDFRSRFSFQIFVLDLFLSLDFSCRFWCLDFTSLDFYSRFIFVSRFFMQILKELQIFFALDFEGCLDILQCLDFCRLDILFLQIFSRFQKRSRFFALDFTGISQISQSVQISALDFILHLDFCFRFQFQIFQHIDFNSRFSSCSRFFLQISARFFLQIFEALDFVLQIFQARLQ